MSNEAARILKGLQQWTESESATQTAEPEATADSFAFAQEGSKPFPKDDPIERFRSERIAMSSDERAEPRRRSTVRRLRSSIEALIDDVMDKDDELRESHVLTSD